MQNPNPPLGAAQEPENFKKDKSTPWKQFLDFLYDGGYRSTIVFSVTLGAIFITANSDRFCQPISTRVVPLQQPNLPVGEKAPPAVPNGAAGVQQKPQPLAQVASLQPTLVATQPNPICNKYFELAFMVVGGYLGLSLPSNQKSEKGDPAPAPTPPPPQPGDDSGGGGAGGGTTKA